MNFSGARDKGNEGIPGMALRLAVVKARKGLWETPKFWDSEGCIQHRFSLGGLLNSWAHNGPP